MSYKIDNIIQQIKFENDKITSLTSGKEYKVSDFVEQISKKLKLTKTEIKELESHFVNYVRPQSEQSKYIENIIEKYEFKFADGVYIIKGEVITIDEIYRLFWKEEKLLPVECDSIIESVEKITDKMELQNEIYKNICNRRRGNKNSESNYLRSLYVYYPDIKWRELFHNILVPNTKPMFHIFYDDGVGGTGKSTLLEVLTKIVGENFVSNVLLDQFGNRFIFSNMLGKYLNIGDDNGKNEELQNVGTLKSIVTGNRVTIDRKNINPIEVRIFAKQLFATNILPYIDFTDGGIMRRLNIIPMNRVIPKDAVMPVIDDEEISAILSECLDADDLIKNNNELAITSSPLYRFMQNNKNSTYSEYQTFCIRNGFRCMNIINFEVKSKFVKHYIDRKLIEVNDNEKIPF